MLWMMLTAALAAPPEPGTWVIAEPEAVIQARIDAAVDKAAAEFGMFKGIARPRIARGAVWCRQYVMDLTADPLRWTCDDKKELATPQDQLGKSRTLNLPQGKVKSVISWEGDDLKARFGDADGARSNVFRFDGDRMVVEISIESSKLSAPVRWTIPYRRR